MATRLMTAIVSMLAGVGLMALTVIAADRGASDGLYFLAMLGAGLTMGYLVSRDTWSALIPFWMSHLVAFILWAPYGGDHDGLAALAIPLLVVPGLILLTVAAKLSAAHRRAGPNETDPNEAPE